MQTVIRFGLIFIIALQGMGDWLIHPMYFLAILVQKISLLLVYGCPDVIVGWLLGAIILWAFVRLWEPIGTRLQNKTLNYQIFIAFVASLAFVVLGLGTVALRTIIKSLMLGLIMRFFSGPMCLHRLISTEPLLQQGPSFSWQLARRGSSHLAGIRQKV